MSTILLALGLLGAATPAAPSSDPRIPHERYRLANGLEVILHQDNSVPLVAVNLWYHVGARNETPGKSGFAHLFEHMLFQGAEHIGEDVHFDVLRKVGGTGVNGSTSFDRTNYYELVPSHQLETALWLESDRMGYFLPMLTEKSFRNQVDVVRNERRQNYDSQPYRGALFPLFAALFPEGHPHRHLVIGLHEHLTSASLDEIRGFYKTWYVPANTTLVLAGDFDREDAKRLIEKWFGSFPRSRQPPSPVIGPVVLPETRRIDYADSFAKLRQLQYVWHAPAAFAEGEPELQVAAHALGAGGTGRLYKLLVVEKQLAQDVSAFVWPFQSAGLFFINVTLKTDARLPEVEQVLKDELAKLTTTPISEPEIHRAVIEREAGFIWGLENLMSRAEALQRYNHYVGEPDLISRELEGYRKVTGASLLTQVKRILGRPRVEVVITPAARTATEGR